MAKKSVKKTVNRKPSIILADFINKADNNSELLIENKIVKDKSIIDILFQEYNIVKFKNVNFTGEIAMHFLDETDVRFEECTFDKTPIIIGSSDLHFEKCKFKMSVSVHNIKFSVVFYCCNIKNILDIELCKAVSIRNSNVHDFRASRHFHGELYFMDSAIKMITVVDSNCSDFTAHGLKCEIIEISRSLIDDIYMVDSSKYTIGIFQLSHVYISNSLNISNQRINTFTTHHVTVAEECEFNTDFIKEWNIQHTNGIIPPSKEIILYKKVALWYGSKRCCKQRLIAKLIVPAEAKRVYCGLDKIRVSEAKCIGFYNCDGTEYIVPKGYYITSLQSDTYYYELNKICKPTLDFDETPGICGSGIHGFIDFNEAVNY